MLTHLKTLTLIPRNIENFKKNMFSLKTFTDLHKPDLVLYLNHRYSSQSSSIVEVSWRVTFEVVDTLTGSSSLAGRPFEEQPHELYRKWKVYTGN